jgi:hypothetical protein
VIPYLLGIEIAAIDELELRVRAPSAAAGWSNKSASEDSVPFGFTTTNEVSGVTNPNCSKVSNV